MTYYGVLCVPNFSDISAVKRSYRELVLKYHPDRSKEPNAENIMKVINNAYRVLSKEKEKYDNWLRRKVQPQVIIMNWSYNATDNSSTGATGWTSWYQD